MTTTNTATRKPARRNARKANPAAQAQTTDTAAAYIPEAVRNDSKCQTRQVGGVLWVWGNTFPHREALRLAGYMFDHGKTAWRKNTATANPEAPSPFRSLGIFEGQRRARAVEALHGTPDALDAAAAELAAQVPANAVIVPMPAACGYATHTRELARRVAAAAGADYVNTLTATPYKWQETPPAVEMTSHQPLPEGRPVVVVANIIDSGIDARAAAAAIPGAEVLAYCHTIRPAAEVTEHAKAIQARREARAAKRAEADRKQEEADELRNMKAAAQEATAAA